MADLIRGVFPIVYTPFDDDGRIDEADLRSLVDYLITQGAHGLSAVGGASECHKLTIGERKWLAEKTIQAAAGKVPVLVGTSATNVSDSLDLTRHASAIGAVGTFCTPPLHGGRTTETLRAFYGALARATDLPILIQDALVVVPPPVIARLGEEFANLRWVKEEAADSGHRMSELQRVCTAGLTIMSGGSYLLDDLARGAVGAIPGSVGVGDLARAYDRFVAGERVAARIAYNHFLPLSFFRKQFPLAASKEVLRRSGVIKHACLRDPKDQTLDEQDQFELEAIMEAMGPPF
ncbi:MAG TPA: dihydrodipicolinate synthase family protein [Chloroflexota bacterium]|nr:dihydrodipicolinate synthase family protein [Chloroflexota bacterium]